MARRTKAEMAANAIKRRKRTVRARSGPSYKSITLERLATTRILGRMQAQALGELPKSKRMTGIDLACANALINKTIPNAATKIDFEGTINVIVGDPRQRPPDHLTRRKKAAVPVPGDS